MARKADPNSVRQRAFKLLDTLKDVKREDVLAILKNRFNIGDRYAETLYASYRTIAKNTGVMIQVYSVRDIKDGKPVKPYMKVENTFNPDANDARSPEVAVQQYQKELEKRIAQAAKL